MECKKEKKMFRVVGIPGAGAFKDFGTEVPKLAQQLLARKEEIMDATDSEIALFEPKQGAEHQEGAFYVGLLVKDPQNKVPAGMKYIELANDYVSTRGPIAKVGELHHHLLTWADEQGHKRDEAALIIETYHPLDNGEEEVEIYLPVK